MDQTERTVKTIERIFNARSLAVVGASNDPRKFGYMTLNSIIQGGYEGNIYPVNPRGGAILGLKTYRSISEIPEKVDTIVVLVPAKFVPEVLREAAEREVAGAVVCSGGFRESGRLDLETEIRSISKETGLRVIGPNIAGVNYLPNKMCAMFFPVITTRGPVAVVSQSGTVTNALSEWAADEGMGISAAINLGNQVDLCESDFLDYLAMDENTKAIAMYIEGVEDGRRFLRALKRATGLKPVAILKAGRTQVGKRSASSHTGALAANHEVFNKACRQCGAIVAEDLEALYDYAKALAVMRPPKGNRIFSISSSGGAGTLAADVIDAYGLSMPDLPDASVGNLRRLKLSSLATLSNPFDTGADLDVEHFKEVAVLVDTSDLADVIFLNFGDPMAGAPEMVKDLDTRINSSLAVGYFAGGQKEKLGRLKMHEAGFPVFPVPERAIRGIWAAVQNSRFRQTRGCRGEELPLAEYRAKYRAIGEKAYLPESKAIEYLQQYHIPYPAHGLAHSEDEAVKIADRLGYPVVLKVVSPDIPHKSDMGGVAVGIESPVIVAHEYRRICDVTTSYVPSATLEGVLVCQQAKEGMEVIVGALEDSLFGPTVVFGLGGIYTELLRDVTFRIAPFERIDAEEMIREIRGYPLLAGARGRSRYDIDQLIELLMSVSRLIINQPEIDELDLNPVRLFEQGLMALDVRVFKREPASIGEE